MVVEHGIDRRVGLHQDETRPGCIKKGYVPARDRGQMPAADDLHVAPRASRNVAHGDAEVDHGSDRNRLTSPGC
jgi:hypothetical protein